MHPDQIMTPEAYIESLYPPDPVLERVKKGIRDNGMPEISIEPGYGRLLTLLVRLMRARSVLEIGALGGYSGICLARGLPEDGRLVSLEINPEYAEIARRHLTEAGYGERVEYRIGDAAESLRQLRRENARFDLILIDADKLNYPRYLEEAIALGGPGALIVADNPFLRGRTLDPNRQGDAVVSIREFNRRLAADPRLESTILPGYDGLCLARVRDDAVLPE
ncbi:O-methyltransferase [Paenibacillus thermoaerophilus]|uniref:O-methyltransferase n=1 Tax=Paenibacillus thermoaerophilus TaxID=1215385 RepID=A0ABW2V7C9_9BACL|nr:O-methyltransferase [Paenibacillus thermoaerophilus]TMV17873.1 O-methyltransferase [Paenibacillus thermoaerophilus]